MQNLPISNQIRVICSNKENDTNKIIVAIRFREWPKGILIFQLCYSEPVYRQTGLWIGY